MALLGVGRIWHTVFSCLAVCSSFLAAVAPMLSSEFGAFLTVRKNMFYDVPRFLAYVEILITPDEPALQGKRGHHVTQTGDPDRLTGLLPLYHTAFFAHRHFQQNGEPDDHRSYTKPKAKKDTYQPPCHGEKQKTTGK
jgi:hypothetical protein